MRFTEKKTVLVLIIFTVIIQDFFTAGSFESVLFVIKSTISVIAFCNTFS